MKEIFHLDPDQFVLSSRCSGYASFLVFSCLYGLFTGVWIAACSPILLSILSLHLLPPAFGLMTAIQVIIIQPTETGKICATLLVQLCDLAAPSFL